MSLQESLRLQVVAAIRSTGRQQKWVARRIGISEKHLSRMLTGRAVLTLGWAERITGLLDIPMKVTVGEEAPDREEIRQAVEETTKAYTFARDATEHCLRETANRRRLEHALRVYVDRDLYSGPEKVDACSVREKLLSILQSRECPACGDLGACNGGPCPLNEEAQ